MRVLVFLLLTICRPTLAKAEFYFSAIGKYQYSRLEQQTATQQFTMVSQSSSGGEGELGIGGPIFEIFANGTYLQENYVAPSTRNLQTGSINTSSYGGGLRLKTPWIWFFATATQRELIYTQTSGADLQLEKAPMMFAGGGVSVFGFGSFYLLSVDARAEAPIGEASTSWGQAIKSKYWAEVRSRIEIGRSWRIGGIGGVEGGETQIGDTTYFKSGLFIGITLTIGGPGGGRGGSYQSKDPPRYPL